MTQTNAGLAGVLGINAPRLTLVPAHCAEGISKSGAGFKVLHTLSGKELGYVAKMLDGEWGYVCPGYARLGTICPDHDYSGFASADTAAAALDAHTLEHRAVALRDQCQEAIAADRDKVELGERAVLCPSGRNEAVGGEVA